MYFKYVCCTFWYVNLQIAGAYWLDILPDVVDTSSGGLKQEFKLDGTHIHSSYVQLLEQQIKKI